MSVGEEEDDGDAAPLGSSYNNKHGKEMSEPLKGKEHMRVKQESSPVAMAAGGVLIGAENDAHVPTEPDSKELWFVRKWNEW